MNSFLETIIVVFRKGNHHENSEVVNMTALENTMVPFHDVQSILHELCTWFCCALLCCSYVVSSWLLHGTYLPIFFMVTSLTLGQSYYFHNASAVTLKDMGKILIPNHNKSKPFQYFLGCIGAVVVFCSLARHYGYISGNSTMITLLSGLQL